MWETGLIESKYNIYRGKDCMKKVCISLREHVMEIISFKKKKNEVTKVSTAKICDISQGKV